MSSTSLEKKTSDEETGTVERGASPQVEVTEVPHIDPVLEKQVVRRVDFRLLPILGALYSFSLIDRSNLSLIYVAGAAKDLGLTIGSRYSITILVFFVPYIVLELPSNLVVRKVGAAVWLTGITVLWGVAMLSMGFVQTWEQLAGLRAMLGGLEAGFFPACTYLISVWYTRREMQLRLATFYLVSVLAGGFSPILAYGLSTLHGRNGLAGWRWILVVEGIITICFGIIAYPLIVDFPEKNKFLTAEQTELVKNRIQADRGDSEYDQITAQKLIKYAGDFKIWVFSLMFFSSTVAPYAFANFLPVILAGMGMSVRDSQLMAAPPYVVACVFALIAAAACDRYGHRGLFLIGQALLCLTGLLITAYAKDTHARYAGVFLGMMGCQANVPCVLAYQSTNILGQSKRAFSNAIVVAAGGVGGIYSALVFRSQDAPGYLPGLWATVACQLLIIVLTGSMTFYFHRANTAAKSGKAAIEGNPKFFYSL